jgi:cytidyltransferase-like protein
MENKKYILYGASFNPPHLGHFSAMSQMLEEHDYIIVFPYPRKHAKGVIEELPPLKQRMKMLDIFISEYFPKMKENIILMDLATEMGLKDRLSDNTIIHTYDYLQYIKNNIPKNSKLSLCLGLDGQIMLEKESFYKQDEIENEFNVFKLEEENKIKSEDIRKFFSDHKNITSLKDEQFIRYAVGNALAEHIFEHNLYGVKKNKKTKKINVKP